MKKVSRWLVALLVACVTIIGVKVNSTDASTLSNCSDYSIGTTQNGTLSEENNDIKYYKFTLDESGSIQMTGSAYMREIKFYLYDADVNEIWNKELSWNSTSEVITIDETLYLTSGTYYLGVSKNYYRYYGNYDFKINFTSSNESFKEVNKGSNNSLATANEVNTDGKKYNAQIAVNDEKDFWKFTLNQSGCVKYDSTFYNIQSVEIKLYDKNANELIDYDDWWNDTTKEITFSRELYLTSGTYYIAVSRGRDNGRYDFSLNFTSSNETFPESIEDKNNTIAESSTISMRQTYTGQLAINDEKDFYKFNLDSSKPVMINLTSPMERVNVHVYNTSGDELNDDTLYMDSVTQKITYKKILTLTAGTYYIAVEKNGYYGTYTIETEEVTQDNCPHEHYTPTWHDSTYFAKGYRVYKCDICGYTYKADYADKLVLPQGYLYTYSSTVGKGFIKPVWSKVFAASGYQIRYCSKSSMKGAKVKTIKGMAKNSIKISKLSKKKKYYVQVRPYKKSGNKTVYGKWSNKLTLKTR